MSPVLRPVMSPVMSPDPRPPLSSSADPAALRTGRRRVLTTLSLSAAAAAAVSLLTTPTLDSRKVSRAVSTVGNEGPELISPLPE